MDPISIAAMLGTTALSGLFGASSAKSSAKTQALSAQIQAAQEGISTLQQAEGQGRVVGDQADTTFRAAAEQFGEVAGATTDQVRRIVAAQILAAQIARQNAELATAQGQLAENRTRDATERTLATQRMFFGGNGIDPASGSALALQARGTAQGEMDALIVRAGAATERSTQQYGSLSALMKADDAIAAGGFSLDAAHGAATRLIDATGRAGGITIDNLNSTSGRRVTSLQTTADITAANARAAGNVGAATALLNTATSWAGLAGKGSFGNLTTAFKGLF